jgi:aminomethyltransferase
MAELRRSPLDARHRALGATLTAFAGWQMPLHYGGVVAEHRAVRESCGVFDLSHLGTLEVRGDGAQRCLQHALTADAFALQPGRAVYALCLDDDAGIVDDLLLYRLPDRFLVVPNAANAATVRGILEECAASSGPCEVRDVKAQLACLAIQGPAAPHVATAAGLPVEGLGYLDCRDLADLPHLPGGGLLARSGYTGERGYEAFVAAVGAPDLWDRVLSAGASPVGLGARDTLRLEMGYPLHGSDISMGTSPVDARLTWAVRRGTGFRGEDAYERALAAGPSRRLWGLRATGRGIPRAGCVVCCDGQRVGRTTSGTFSPTLRLGIALGYLDAEIEPGTAVEIEVRGKSLAAEVVRPPFVDADPRDGR